MTKGERALASSAVDRHIAKWPVAVAAIAAVAAMFSGNGTRGQASLPTMCLDAFQVSVDEESERALFQAAAAAIHAAYDHLASNSTTSHHFYVRTATREVQDAVSAVAWSPTVIAAVREKFPRDTSFIRDVFDEVFVSRPNFDFAGDHGLYTTHYDGNMQVPNASVCTIRAITYLEGPSADFVALSSGRNFSTTAGTAAIIDFNNELHFVDVSRAITGVPRLIIKSGLHVTRSDTPSSTRVAYIGGHRLVFFIVKTVMEFTKGAKTVLHKVIGLFFNNGFRWLNNVHMALPLLCGIVPLLAMLAAVILFPLQYLSYMINIYAVLWRSLDQPTFATVSFAVRTVAQLSLLYQLEPTHWAWLRLRGFAGLAAYACGAFLHARAFCALGWVGTYYGRELGATPLPSLTREWPYDGTITHPMHAAITLEIIGVGLLCGHRVSWRLLFALAMHVAWTWVTAFCEAKTDTAHATLFAPCIHVVNEANL